MSIEKKFVEKDGESQRYETLKLKDIDVDYLEQRIRNDLRTYRNSHEKFFQQREKYLLSMRDLMYQYKQGYFEDASDLHIPYTLIMKKAMHAKLFEVFSPENFFSVEAQNLVFKEKEEVVSTFMNWQLNKQLNRGEGKSDMIDDWLDQVVEEGSGILKLWSDRWEHAFVDLEIETQIDQSLNFLNGENNELDIENQENVTAKISDVKKVIEMVAPAAGVVAVEDFFMPSGHRSVQTAPYVCHRVRLSDEDLKLRAKHKKFDSKLVDEALERRRNYSGTDDTVSDTKRRIRELEGIDDQDINTTYKDDSEHVVYEWYGRAYVEKSVDDDTFEDADKLPSEIVVWYHEGIRKIIGWTYLHRISPSGRRPFYKADFIPAKQRAIGIGVGELLFSLNNHIDAMHNLKMDNGMLSSMQFGVYRAGSSFKPDTFRINPGDLLPVENTNDIKMLNIPYLGQFGEKEELALNSYGEKLLATNDVTLGNVGGKGVAGALRNATGANFIDRQANIQMHPHLDRVSRALKSFLGDLFVLARARMKPEVFFRVTGEDGKGIFGNIKKEDLRGDYDFTIDVNLAASSESEKQQRVSLMLQTLLNPTFMQTGLVQPGNLYELLKEFLIRHQIRQPDRFITKPLDYIGPPLTPEQRLMKIMLNSFDNPPVEASVKPEEDHERALEVMQAFHDDDLFGVLEEEQVQAFAAVQRKHQEFLSLLQGGAAGVPNTTGTQFSNQGGLPSLGPGGDAGAEGIPNANASEGGPLGSPVGEPNGPVQ